MTGLGSHNTKQGVANQCSKFKVNHLQLQWISGVRRLPPDDIPTCVYVRHRQTHASTKKNQSCVAGFGECSNRSHGKGSQYDVNLGTQPCAANCQNKQQQEPTAPQSTRAPVLLYQPLLHRAAHER